MKMTLISDIICPKIKGFCTKKVLIYVFAISCIVTLVVAALVVVYFTKWANNLNDDSEDWNYIEQDKWPELCKISKVQSPVALSQRYAYKKELSPINLTNFGEWSAFQFEIENNGHSIVVYPSKICKCKKPKLSGGMLTKNYTMENIHFHWPSEHTINDVQYDIETHFVFYADKYGTFKEALKHPYGLAVISILSLQVTSTASNNYRVIADAVKKVSSKPGSSATATGPIKLHEFLPYDHESFFAYDGSLTTPGCTEYVSWMVYRNPSNIAYFDLQDITTIYTKRNTLLKENNRSLQDINERTIYLHDPEL